MRLLAIGMSTLVVAISLAAPPASAGEYPVDPSLGPNPCVGVRSAAAQAPGPSGTELKRLTWWLGTPITDGHGYTITPRDAAYFLITPQQLANWRNRTAPLTMTAAEYGEFSKEIYAAMAADGLDGRVDVRMSGSGAKFWSNPTKAMPYDAETAAAVYTSYAGKWPSSRWCRVIAKRFAEWLGPKNVGNPSAVPRFRPFNSLRVMGITPEPSDVDLTIASDQLARNSAVKCIELALPYCQHPRYDFYNRLAVPAAMPRTEAVMKAWTDRKQIPFTFAGFDLAGPPNAISHYRATDWAVMTPCEGSFCSG